MTAYEEALAPLVDLIAARVVVALKKEFRQAPSNEADRSLSKKEVAEMLGLTEPRLMIKVNCMTVPPPYTARGEKPYWSSKTIEKYMSGEWGSTK